MAKEHHHRFNDNPLDFSSPWQSSDVVLVVEGTKFYVHKSTLTMCSLVFEKMFTSPFLEKTAKEIPLPGKCRKEFEVLLRLVYSNGRTQNVNDDNCFFLLQLAEEYQMDVVKKHCSDYLLSSIQEDNCLYLCSVADRFNLQDVKVKCVEEARYMASKSLRGNEDYEDLPPELKNSVCMERIKELEKLLHEYTTASSTLAECVYHTTAERLFQEPCKHLDNHRRLYTVSGGFISESIFPFDLTCKSCTQRVEAADWNKVGSSHCMPLKTYLRKLRALNGSKRVAASIISD